MLRQWSWQCWRLPMQSETIHPVLSVVSMNAVRSMGIGAFRKKKANKLSLSNLNRGSGRYQWSFPG